MNTSGDASIKTKGTTTESLAPDWLISHLRWPWLIVTFLIVWLNPEPMPQAIPYVYAIIGVGVVANLIHIILLSLRRYPSWMRVSGITLDIAIATALLLATGGWKSPLLLIILFPVMAAALRLGIEAGLLATTPFLLVYVGSALIDRTFVPRQDLYELVTNILLVLGVVLVSGLLQARQEGTTHQFELKELEELRRASKKAAVVHQMAAALSATLDYTRVLRTMLDLSIMAASDAGEPDTTLVGLVLLFEQEKNFEHLKVYVGRNMPRPDENRRIAGQSGLIAHTIHSAEAQISQEPAGDPVLSQLLSMQNAHSVLCVPLRAGFDIFGVVILGSPKADHFNPEHAELLTTVCQQAVIALKNAQLYEDLKIEQRRILEKESEARQRLARELHDGPTQTISAIVMRLNFARMLLERDQPKQKVVDELSEIEELARKTTQEVRTMLFTLRPVALETQGLVTALERYTERLRQDGLNVHLDAKGYQGQLRKEAEAVVFLVVEEAVNNAKKHANAELVGVRLRADNQKFYVEIRDDGLGFDVEAARHRREVGHMGLLNIEERVEYLGGRYTIQSRQGSGTAVQAEIPLERWSRET